MLKACDLLSGSLKGQVCQKPGFLRKHELCKHMFTTSNKDLNHNSSSLGLPDRYGSPMLIQFRGMFIVAACGTAVELSKQDVPASCRGNTSFGFPTASGRNKR